MAALPEPVGYPVLKAMDDWTLLATIRPYLFGGGPLEPDWRWLSQELFWRLSAKTDEEMPLEELLREHNELAAKLGGEPHPLTGIINGD